MCLGKLAVPRPCERGHPPPKLLPRFMAFLGIILLPRTIARAEPEEDDGGAWFEEILNRRARPYRDDGGFQVVSSLDTAWEDLLVSADDPSVGFDDRPLGEDWEADQDAWFEFFDEIQLASDLPRIRERGWLLGGIALITPEPAWHQCGADEALAPWCQRMAHEIGKYPSAIAVPVAFR